MYLAEMAPPNLRGAIVMVAHLFFAIGVLLAQVFGLHLVLGTNTGWPILLGLTAIPAFIQILLLPSFPESPRYLLIQGKNEMAARQALKMLRGRDDVEDEIEELRQEDLAEAAEKSMNIFKILCFPSLRWQVISVFVLILGQQLSGINIVYFYLESIYLSTGIEEVHIQYFSVVVTLVLVLVVLGTVFVVDSWGRRCLLLTGFGTCSLACVFLTMSLDLQNTVPWMSYFSTAFVIIFRFGHIIGPAPIPSVVIAELFLQSSRSTAFVIGGSLHWLCNLIVLIVFFHIEGMLWTYTFLIFLPFSIATFYYIFRVIPETKNKTFLEIRANLVKKYAA
ncbi:solute carrier family 2, facilitated glucose transporter member 5-like [Tiliqua scincoides]|uniref:solute carrier family 2, facilitated glucose transporter member 5-like n=1 Tax=Tiliqua scincoides TaxID=71010 RepID=UPI0034634BE8